MLFTLITGRIIEFEICLVVSVGAEPRGRQKYSLHFVRFIILFKFNSKCKEDFFLTYKITLYLIFNLFSYDKNWRNIRIFCNL